MTREAERNGPAPEPRPDAQDYRRPSYFADVYRSSALCPHCGRMINQGKVAVAAMPNATEWRCWCGCEFRERKESDDA